MDMTGSRFMQQLDADGLGWFWGSFWEDIDVVG